MNIQYVIFYNHDIMLSMKAIVGNITLERVISIKIQVRHDYVRMLSSCVFPQCLNTREGQYIYIYIYIYEELFSKTL